MQSNAAHSHDETSGPGAEASLMLTIQLNGQTVTVPHRPGTTILQAARAAGLRPPSSCELGSCATCIAVVADGLATMRTNDVLSDAEVAEGLILTCQAEPTSPTVTVIYE